MAGRQRSVITEDFAQVLDYLKVKGVVAAAPSAELIQLARAVHQSTYVLILWRFRLIDLPVRSAVFIEEIASDSLQILPQLLMGYSKTTKLLVRGIVENTLRHIYFSDHPVEFARMNRESKWYITVDQLFDYIRNHQEFLKTEPKFNAIGQMSSLYSDLSAGVHGRRVQDLEMRTALEKIAYSHAVAQKEAELVKRCGEAVNFILSIYHREQLRKLEAVDRRPFLDGLTKTARQVWAAHETEVLL
jgi:hypothetical protein